MTEFRYTKKEVDPEEVWNMLIQLGSFDKVSKNLAGRGIVNPKTNQPIHVKTLSTITWTWVVTEPERAFEMLKVKYPNTSDEYWEQFLVAKAFGVYVTRSHSRRYFIKWLEEHKLEKYKDYRKSPYFSAAK